MRGERPEPPRLEGLGERGGPPHRGRREPLGGHASARPSRCRRQWGIDLYLKDESVHPTGSLKHRLARSLFLYGLCNGWIHERHDGRRRVQRLDGRLRGVLRPLPRAAVHRRHAGDDEPGEDRPDRVGGRHVPPRRRSEHDRRRGAAAGGRVRRATSSTSSPSPSARRTGAATTTSRSRSSARWRWSAPDPGMGGRRRRDRRDERDDRPLRAADALPDAAVRRRSRGLDLLLALGGRPAAFTGRPSRIEGIGRQRVEPSFLPDIVDRMIQVPDAASIATMRLVRAHRTQRRRLHRHQRLGRARCSSPRCSRAASAAASSRSSATAATATPARTTATSGSRRQGSSSAPYAERARDVPRRRRVRRRRR